MSDLNPPLTELLDALEAAQVFTAMDPSDVNTPGGWLAVDGMGRASVRGDMVLRCSLFLISGDRDPLAALDSLGDLFTKALTVLTPDGEVVTQGVVLPSDPTPLPALRVPIHLYY